ncbi:MAG: LysR family transcriptional regulator [Casimicrobium sp.]
MKTPQGRDRIKRFLRHGSLPQLAAFYAVVQMGSVTRAAEALCVAQPTLSGHLRKLSESLGVALFETRGKSLVPTDSAMVLLETAKQVFEAFEQCELRLASLRGTTSAEHEMSLSKPQLAIDSAGNSSAAMAMQPAISVRSLRRPAALNAAQMVVG